MNRIGKIIIKTRKYKGFTQEELADLSKVNLRTIQRIENNKSQPRGKTLDLIANALEIDIETLVPKKNELTNRYIGDLIVNGFYLVLLNISLMTIIGFMTLPGEANINSRIGALLLSFFIPFFIVYYTKKMTGIERLIKFGIGFIFYIFFIFILHGFKTGFQIGIGRWIFFCFIVAFGVLYYGNYMIKNK